MKEINEFEVYKIISETPQSKDHYAEIARKLNQYFNEDKERTK